MFSIFCDRLTRNVLHKLHNSRLRLLSFMLYKPQSSETAEYTRPNCRLCHLIQLIVYLAAPAIPQITQLL